MNLYDIRFLIYYHINDVKTLNRCFQVDKLSHKIYYDNYYWHYYFKKNNYIIYNNDWLKSLDINILTTSIINEFNLLSPVTINGICINVNNIPEILTLFKPILCKNTVCIYEVRILKMPKKHINLFCIVSETCYEGYKHAIDTLDIDINENDINDILYHLIYHNECYQYSVYSY